VKNVVTLFHKPSSQASIRAHTILKQANAHSVSTATEDQASSHDAHSKAQRTEFELDVTEEPPTGDQLKNILEYLGGPSAVGRVIEGAKDETDALRRLKADGNSFQRPLVVDWNQGKAGKCTAHVRPNCNGALTDLLQSLVITSPRSLVCSRTSLLRRSRVHGSCKLINVFGIRLVIETSLVKSCDLIVSFSFVSNWPVSCRAYDGPHRCSAGRYRQPCNGQLQDGHASNLDACPCKCDHHPIVLSHCTRRLFSPLFVHVCLFTPKSS